MTALVRLVGTRGAISISIDTVVTIWDDTPENCNLRRWLVDVLQNAQPDKIDGYGDDLPHDLLREMFRAHKSNGETLTAYPDPCKYHDHVEGVRACGTVRFGPERVELADVAKAMLDSWTL